MTNNGFVKWAVVFLGFVVAAPATATAPWPPIDPSTIEGVWVSPAFASCEMMRLEVGKDAAVLAVNRGAKQAEFLFRSTKWTVSRGKLVFVASDAALGISVRVSGEGRAHLDQGQMTLSIVNVGREGTFWEDRRQMFVKGDAQPRLADLLEMETRAKALIVGRERRRVEESTRTPPRQAAPINP
jgi:hypothetical protein